MSVLWTEAPRHQAPTCPPQPGLLPASLSQSCQDPGPPGPCKVTLSLLIYPFRQTPPDALLFVSLAGGPPGSPAQPRGPPCPTTRAPPASLWPPGHVLAMPHPTQTCLRSLPAAPWASRGLSKATGAGNPVWARTAASGIVPSSPWSTRQGPDHSFEQGQCGHCPGGTNSRSSAGGSALLQGPGGGRAQGRAVGWVCGLGCWPLRQWDNSG